MRHEKIVDVKRLSVVLAEADCQECALRLFHEVTGGLPPPVLDVREQAGMNIHQCGEMLLFDSRLINDGKEWKHTTLPRWSML